MGSRQGTRTRFHQSGRWVAAATLLGAAAIDVAYGRQASLSVTMVFAAFVASALTPPRDTAVVGAAAVVVAYGLGWPDGSAGSSAQLVRTLAVAAGAALAVALAYQRTRREAQLVAVRRVADTAQQAILHPLPAQVGSLSLTGRYLSATAEARIGGDFYEALDTPWGGRLIVGDVRGKGLDAVRLAAVILGEFRSRGATEPRIADVVAFVDRATALAGSRDGEDFATAVVAELSADDFTMIRCGHPQPLCSDADGVVATVEIAGTLPLGLGADGDMATSLRLTAGQRLLLYSDGAVETHDATGRDFDLQSSFGRSATLAADRALQQIVDELHHHAGGDINDDVVLVIAELSPAVPAVLRPGRMEAPLVGDASDPPARGIGRDDWSSTRPVSPGRKAVLATIDQQHGGAASSNYHAEGLP